MFLTQTLNIHGSIRKVIFCSIVLFELISWGTLGLIWATIETERQHSKTNLHVKCLGQTQKQSFQLSSQTWVLQLCSVEEVCRGPPDLNNAVLSIPPQPPHSSSRSSSACATEFCWFGSQIPPESTTWKLYCDNAI